MAEDRLQIPSDQNEFHSRDTELLLSSYEHWTGEPLLLARHAKGQRSLNLWESPVAVVSHNTLADPIFWYGNKTALRLFEMTWEEFTTLPSRLSAESGLQEDRERLLAEVRSNGFSKNYRGVRVSKTGRRFQIEDAVVWNIINPVGVYCGQAAAFGNWTFLDGGNK